MRNVFSATVSKMSRVTKLLAQTIEICREMNLNSFERKELMFIEAAVQTASVRYSIGSGAPAPTETAFTTAPKTPKPKKGGTS